MGYCENGVEVGDLAENRRRNEIGDHNIKLQEEYPVYTHQETPNEDYYECRNAYLEGTWCI